MKITFEVDNKNTLIFNKPDYIAINHFSRKYGEQVLTMSSGDCEKVIAILKKHYSTQSVPMKQGEKDV